ncbi:MAG: hypothetical protein QM703_22170 [Gemmatales bacterium]
MTTEAIAFTIFTVIFFTACWRFIRFYKYIQDSMDRRYNDGSPTAFPIM